MTPRSPRPLAFAFSHQGPNGEICCSAALSTVCPAMPSTGPILSRRHALLGRRRQSKPGSTQQLESGLRSARLERRCQSRQTALAFNTEGGMDPSPFRPTPGQKERILDRGKPTANRRVPGHTTYLSLPSLSPLAACVSRCILSLSLCLSIYMYVYTSRGIYISISVCACFSLSVSVYLALSISVRSVTLPSSLSLSSSLSLPLPLHL